MFCSIFYNLYFIYYYKKMNSKYINTIINLLNITEDNGNTLNEMNIAIDKIKLLREKHNITIEEIELGKYNINEDFVEIGYKSVPIYLNYLCSSLVTLYNCKAIRKNNKFYFYGIDKDVIICKYFYIYLSRKLISLSKGQKNKNSYCCGIINEVIKRLTPEKNNDTSLSDDKSLIVIKKNIIENYIQKIYGSNITSQSIKITGTKESYNNGSKVGKTISLNTAINNKNNRLMIT